MADYALAIGMDTAQAKPGDALEYTAASGGAAFIIGPGEDALASIDAHYSFVTDTPIFGGAPIKSIPSMGSVLPVNRRILATPSQPPKPCLNKWG
jgi:hydroxymethylglutaryl-CoA synthase